MKLIVFLILNFLLLFNLDGAKAQSVPIAFSVQHKHQFGHCEGILRINQEGASYESLHRKHARVWRFSDIRHVEILSPRRLALRGYGKPETFDFRLREAELTVDAYWLLAKHVERGLTSRVLFPATEFRFELAAKHRHPLGGCNGVLRIGANEIVYETDKAEDRRLWRIRDIRSFGTTGPYDLRLTTEMETFTFDLKEPLKQDVYDHLWQEIYGVQFAPVRNSP